MPPRRIRLACLCVAVATGCALGTQRFGREIDEKRIPSLEVGVSTKADVLRLFGPPTAYSRLPAVHKAPPYPCCCLTTTVASSRRRSGL